MPIGSLVLQGVLLDGSGMNREVHVPFCERLLGRFRRSTHLSIIGLGWLGWPLAKQLAASGYHVRGSVTSMTKKQQLATEKPEIDVQCWQADEQAELPDSLFAPLMIITIPPGKLSRYFEALQSLVLQARQHGVQHLIYISSTSVYGGTGRCDETL